jgi:hypothetical protein
MHVLLARGQVYVVLLGACGKRERRARTITTAKVPISYILKKQYGKNVTTKGKGNLLVPTYKFTRNKYGPHHTGGGMEKEVGRLKQR